MHNPSVHKRKIRNTPLFPCPGLEMLALYCGQRGLLTGAELGNGAEANTHVFLQQQWKSQGPG